MTNMDHNEAVRLQAAEKYLSGEFTRAQRDEYEEHYFDCPTCAEELKATVAFMESAKQDTREFSPQTNENKGLVNGRRFGWLGCGQRLQCPHLPPCCWSLCTKTA